MCSFEMGSINPHSMESQEQEAKNQEFFDAGLRVISLEDLDEVIRLIESGKLDKLTEEQASSLGNYESIAIDDEKFFKLGGNKEVATMLRFIQTREKEITPEFLRQRYNDVHSKIKMERKIKALKFYFENITTEDKSEIIKLIESGKLDQLTKEQIEGLESNKPIEIDSEKFFETSPATPSVKYALELILKEKMDKETVLNLAY